MPGYFDPNHAQNTQSWLDGEQEGKRRGRQQGYDAGFADGRLEGWNQAVDHCNGTLDQQIEYTRQHADARAALEQQLAEQTAKVLELKKIGQDLIAMAQKLEAEVAEKDEELQRQKTAYSALVRNYNHNYVLVMTARSVIEQRSAASPEDARALRSLFAPEYDKRVKKAVGEGLIQGPLEADAAFQKAMPQTCSFILQMVSGSNGRQPES